MINSNIKLQVLPIPWMKQKLEYIYDTHILGNLYLMYNEMGFGDPNQIIPSIIHGTLEDYNICIDNIHPLYLYLPAEVNELTKKLIDTFKALYSNNVFIILGGYKEYYPTNNELNCIADLYMFYPSLVNKIHKSFLIDSTKSYEIFASLSDTQNIYVNPKYSCTISGPTLGYNLKNHSPNNITHLSFIKLLEECDYYNIMDYYLNGLSNTNNNFKFNY
ncbi:MAG: hypothetical protein RSD22_00520 [Romboutsia sp.]